MKAKSKQSKRGGRRPGAGRPAGTPNKSTRELKELAGEYTERAVKTLVEVMEDPDAPPAARVAAADRLLDRGHGRPVIPADEKSQHEPMNLIEIAKMFDERMKRARERQRQVLIERGLLIEETTTGDL